MKPFQFSLESLLVLRRQKEQTAQQRYARMLTDCEEAKLKLQRAATELAGGRTALSHELGLGVTAGRLSALRAWCQALESRWETSRTTLDETRRSAALAFREMVAAARGRETLDRFHDKQKLAHTRAVHREEQKTLDELAVQMSGADGPLQFRGPDKMNPS
jgi:flagellar export protein FliJ